ncbi:heme-binding protein [Novosphingobium profundi]|uniref:GlcG/HbpS family heme-binding protein n=1 Tax=Novosphingobium profundi TaxID=1774954 RepID=UPI001BDB2C5E|nr:heme-binding protein [Novosphingobium profundi]MBT0670115.1 heme-binding protein [Novosphingobium profundi]
MSGPCASELQQALSAGVGKAEELGSAVCISICDAGGNPAALIRMPGTFLASTGIAMDKAYTAASFGLSTRDFSAMLEGEERGVRDGLLRTPRLCEVPGGFPIRRDGALIGGLGVSGGSAAQDEEIATVCLEILGAAGE